MKKKLKPKTAGRPVKNGQPATDHLHVRVTADQKSAWERAAHPQPLTEWVIAALDLALAQPQRPAARSGKLLQNPS